MVLEAYEEISQGYLPFAYTIVNDYKSYVLSIDSHYFMPYTSFNKMYLKKDSIYHNNINDKLFFKKNPEYILSKSMLVFVHKANVGKLSNLPFYKDENLAMICKNIEILRNRVREVSLVYKKESLMVFEIVIKQSQVK